MTTAALIAGISSSLLFITLNVTMNLYMKWLFSPRSIGEPWTAGGDFPLPWTMLAIQQLEAYIVLQPWIAYKDPAGWGWNLHDVDTFRVMYEVLAVTSLFCLNVGLNSLSLVRISITLNQTVRAFLPVGVLLLATCLERRTYPFHSYVTTGVLVLGIGLTCWGSPNFELYGFFLALASTLVAALGSSLNGRMLSAERPFSKGPAGIMQLMMLQSLPACFMFGLIAAITEAHQMMELFADPGSWQWPERIGLVSISSALALLANLGRCGLVAATSALMETLAGNAKVAALCVIDHHIFGTRLAAQNYCGIGITFTGFSVHVLLQYAIADTEQRSSREASSPKDERKLHTGPHHGHGHHAHFEDESSADNHHEVHEPPRRPLNRPRIISAADTGLVAEHAALEMGRQGKRQRSPEIDNDNEHMPALPRPRSMTWQAGTDASQTLLERMHLDFAPIFEEPTWLTASNDSFGSDDYSALNAVGVTGPANMSMRAGGAASQSSTASSARSRFYTDPSDNGSSANLSRLRSREAPLAPVPEELAAEESPPMEETAKQDPLVFEPL